jgi:hypothetical protein
MRRNTVLGLAGAALALQLTFGCARNNRPDAAPRADGQADQARRADTGGQPGPAARNEQSARQLLQEAEAAESQGQYSLALNLYDRLRSFPEDSRPTDLDQRVNAVRQKMAAEGGGGAGPTTLPIEPR